MNKILVSACLLGAKVRYDGKDNLQNHDVLLTYLKAGKIITLCPEMAGGLATPRAPAEIEPGKTGKDVLAGTAKIITIDGEDVTSAYLKGAQQALALVKEHKIQVAILKARSPSCGSKQIYNGHFSRTLKDGTGLTAELLKSHDVAVFDETEIDLALLWYDLFSANVN